MLLRQAIAAKLMDHWLPTFVIRTPEVQRGFESVANEILDLMIRDCHSTEPRGCPAPGACSATNVISALKQRIEALEYELGHHLENSKVR